MGMVYPYKKYNYSVTFDGKEMGGFSEVNIPASESQPIEYREGNFPVNYGVKLPGLVKPGVLTIKRGVTDDTSLSKWFEESLEGAVTQKQISVSLLDDRRKEVAKWSFTNAWPTKYTAPPLSATANEAAVEEMELAYEAMTREK
jgi:phage tail-like protein